MENRDFDSALQKKLAEETLPFNEQNWLQLEERLDKKERKTLLLPFLPLKRQHLYAAASVTLMLCSVWYFAQRSDRNNNATIITNVQKADLPPAKQTPAQLPTVQERAVPTTPAQPSYAHATKPTTTAPAVQPRQQLPTDTAKGLQPVEENNNDREFIAAQPKKTQQKKTPQFDFNYVPPAREKGMSISINGGVTFVEAGRGFSAGFGITNRISNKVSIETNVGYIQGRQGVNHKRERMEIGEPIIVPSDTGNYVMGGDTSIITWYEREIRNLPFARLGTSVKVHLHDKFSASVGPDIQKVLLNNTDLDALNEKLALESKKVPSFDAGVALKLRYALTRRIGCSISYRESLTGIIDPKTKYIDNDYLLFQLQYTLGKNSRE